MFQLGYSVMEETQAWPTVHCMRGKFQKYADFADMTPDLMLSYSGADSFNIDGEIVIAHYVNHIGAKDATKKATKEQKSAQH